MAKAFGPEERKVVTVSVTQEPTYRLYSHSPGNFCEGSVIELDKLAAHQLLSDLAEMLDKKLCNCGTREPDILS